MTHPSSPLPPADPNWNYEHAVTEVEQIIRKIEQGELHLADVFDQFSAAMERLQQCDAFLNYHRQQIDVLVETLDATGAG
ncbi:MAG: exodeoxyribonuclease VII small subunit [Cyanobacteria bacterium P01_A01_bin.135]